MSLTLFIIILIVHLLLCLRYIFGLSKWLRSRREYLIPILLVPIFGPLMALTVEIEFIINHPGTKPVEMDPLKLPNDILWASLAKTPEDKEVIPLEEAILINTPQTRRRAVLNTFRDDSMKFLDVLMIARSNDDVDTTHYATIQISKIQRDYQIQIQKFAANLEQDPNNLELLDDYIKLLGEYIQSPLPEKSILQHQRQKYAQLLDRRMALTANDKDTLIMKLRNCSEVREDYESAQAIVATLKTNWPEDEQTWIEALRTCVAWKDPERLGQTVDEIRQRKISWTKKGQEQVRAWVQL